MGLLKLTDEQLQTLQAIFEDSARSDISWSNLNDLFTALGAMVKVNGDRVCVVIKSSSCTTRAILHSRNNEEYVSTHAICSIQKFLETARIKVAK